MMRLLLVRHASAPHLDGGWLAGRQPGIALDAAGREQAAALGRALARLPVDAVCSSPLERAVDTARPIAAPHGLSVEVRSDLTDVDFGVWTGARLDALATDHAWARFNQDRQHARAPGGESLAAVQRRMVDAIRGIARTAPGPLVVVVTHAEPIRLLVAWSARASLDAVRELRLDPARVSLATLAGSRLTFDHLNQSADALAHVFAA